MIGAIIGDIIGSVYEFGNIKTKDFPLFSSETGFTDDTVLTIATAQAILNNADYGKEYHSWGNKYIGRGYGGRFIDWLDNPNPQPYNSWGNGSAMRVSPIGFAFNTLDEVLKEAEKSALVTHNHHEGIKGAQAVATAVFLARTGKSKDEIKKYIIKQFDYDLNRTANEIRESYTFDESCQGSVPEAIISFLECSDFEDSIRIAVSLGGDSDTIACIAGAISQAFYKSIPGDILERSLDFLPDEMKEIISAFHKKFDIHI